jgi:MFS family permease
LRNSTDLRLYSAGITGGTLSLLATGVVGIVMFLATIPAVLYVDKFGRKTILIVGGIGMAVSHFIVAGYGYDSHYLHFENILTIFAASRARTRVTSRTTKALLGPLSCSSGVTPSTLAIRESNQPLL